MLRTFAVLGVLVLPALLAQETRNSLSGRITDPQGSAVPGAAVVVTNTGTNTSARLLSNDTGYYVANLLLPGNYTVTVEAAGFKKLVRSGVVLEMGGSSEVSVQL